MFWPFNKEILSDRTKAIREGRLVDMQLPPFRQFNQILNIEYPMVMTRAAYRGCVELPGEFMKAEVPADARWGMVFLTFMEKYQHGTEDIKEGTFDVNVLKSEGFQLSKTIKIVVDNDFDGENAFVFLLPEERWPEYLGRPRSGPGVIITMLMTFFRKCAAIGGHGAKGSWKEETRGGTTKQ